MNRSARLQALSERVKGLAPAKSAPILPEIGIWAARRGEVRASVDCDVIGNFPGSLQSAALIVGARTLVTSLYLVVDEGEPHGFALPLASILDVSLDDAPHAGPDLIVR